MRRALQLAALGEGYASPNPMVGAVIVAGDRIIGEGWHRICGKAHAEVNAVNSVPDHLRHLLPEATIYVTLEPCAHYGKTPPCALLLVDCGIRRIVVATVDPFSKVAGKGIQMLRDAGRVVETGLLGEESRMLNRRFFIAHTLRRPYVMLKWAQSADMKIAATDADGTSRPVKLSTPLSSMFMHRCRMASDAILVGTNTVITDNPRLDSRLWPGPDPLRLTFNSPRLPHDAHMLHDNSLLLPADGTPLSETLASLYSEHGLTSLLVEGGADTLQRFINDSLFDEIRIETAPVEMGSGIHAPFLPTDELTLTDNRVFGQNIVQSFMRSDLLRMLKTYK